MKRALKSYWAFTGKGYRIVVLFLFPLLAVLVPVITGIIEPMLLIIALIGYYIIFMIAEPLSDFWFLGGFYSKNKGAMEFMQSSNRFASVIKDVVVVDLLRRVLQNVFIYLLMVCIGVMTKIEQEGYLLFAFFSIFEILLGEVVTFIGRHFDMWNYYYVVVILGFLMASFFMAYAIINLQELLWLVCLVFLLLALILGVIIVSYTNKKVRDSYYD